MELRNRRKLNPDELDSSSTDFIPSTNATRAIRSLDMFPKAKEDFRRKQNILGGVISAITISIITLLILIDLLSYVFGWNAYRTELSVDRGVSAAVPFDIDITFPSVPCQELSLDAVDASGVEQDNLDHELLKTPVSHEGQLIGSASHRYLDRRILARRRNTQQQQQQQKHHNKNDPNYCGPCMVSPPSSHDNEDIFSSSSSSSSTSSQQDNSNWLTKEQEEAVRRHFSSPEHQNACCNTCDEVFAMYDKHKLPRPPLNRVEQCLIELSKKNPGCNIRGTIYLRKVQGAFFFAPGKGENLGPLGGHIHVFSFDQLMKFNSSHVVNRFRIGDPNIKRFSSNQKQQNVNFNFPLENHRFIVPPKDISASVRYRLQIVPTSYVDLSAASSSKKNAGFSYSSSSSTSENTVSTTAAEKKATSAGGGGTVATSEEVDESEVSYEYAVSESHRYSAGGFMMLFSGSTPSVLFKYDFFAMQLTHVFDRPPFSVFLVRACSMIGGLFVILGLVDRMSQYAGKNVNWESFVSKEMSVKIADWLQVEL